MTARDYLNRAFTIRIQIKLLDERIEEIRTRMASVSAIKYDKVNVQSTPDDPMAKSIAELIEAEERVLQLEAEYSKEYESIYNLIIQLDSDVHKTILIEHYLFRRKFQKIAEDLHYSETYVMKLNSEALREFSKVIES